MVGNYFFANVYSLLTLNVSHLVPMALQTYKYFTLLLLLLLLLLKKIGNARPGEGDWHPISPKTQAPYYQPIEETKRKGK